MDRVTRNLLRERKQEEVGKIGNKKIEML